MMVTVPIWMRSPGAQDDFADDLAVDIGAVGRVEIAKDDVGAALNKDAMPVRDGGVREGNLVIGRTPYMGVFLVELVHNGRQVGPGHRKLRLVVLHADGQRLGRRDRFRIGYGSYHADVGASGALRRATAPKST